MGNEQKQFRTFEQMDRDCKAELDFSPKTPINKYSNDHMKIIISKQKNEQSAKTL